MLVEAYEYSIGAVEPLRRHVHPTWQFAWSPNAPGEHWVRGAIRAMPPGTISIIPPGEVHAPSQQVWVEAPASFMMAYLDVSAIDDVASDLRTRTSGTRSFRAGLIGDDPPLSRLFARAHWLSLAGEPLARDVVWLAFLSRLLTRHADPHHAVAHADREPRAVAAALEILHSRPQDSIALSELARTTNTSPARLCRAFTQQLGLPPHAYQLRLRVENAKQLLLRGHTVADAAAVTGFADQSHLGRHFKRVVGVAPSVYRAAR